MLMANRDTEYGYVGPTHTDSTNSGVVPPGVTGPATTAKQYQQALTPPASTAPGGAPAPRPLTPPTAPATTAPTSGVNPALKTPTAPKAPALVPLASGITNPTTHQTAPTVGLPSGYNLNQGVDASFTGLLPAGFDIGDLRGPNLPDAVAPGASTYVNQGAAQQADMTPWTVTPEQTVQGQFAKLMEDGNPAIQAVMEQTLRAHAASGGRNNTMAMSAAALTGAQVGLTIAAQDAATFAQAGQFNASTANDFAKQMNQFIDNAMLSRQNFDQGVAMLKDQTNQQIQQLYAQVEANAATQSTNLKSTIATLQAQTTATLAQMDKQFAQDTAKMNLQSGISSQQNQEEYGRQVRLSYLSSINTQQTALMQAIGQIAGNPNITAAQAQAATGDAIDQFNSYMTMNNAYYAAMVPSTTGTTNGTYSTAAYDYSRA